MALLHRPRESPDVSLQRKGRKVYAVWEITLACNLACIHCGSRAGKARKDELSTQEALNVIDQLAECGVTEVTLIGGEAFVRKDWLQLVRAIVQQGMTCTLTTGGYGISRKAAEAMREAGLSQVSVSIDGLEESHDHLRGRKGSWKACFQSLGALREAGVSTACNTQINRLTHPELSALYELLQPAGVGAWQLQLTVPMGNAADRPELLLQPWELLELFPTLALLKARADADGIFFFAGNNIGYYSAEDVAIHRRPDGDWSPWTGCHAGLNTLGIEADGTLKGCPSLPTRAYRGGNLRTQRLKDLLEQAPQLKFNLGARCDHLWGFCASCEYADLCRGGCTWTAHVFFGRSGNNPYCHHRALSQARKGIRERLVAIQAAEGSPFDHGRFELVEESLF